MGQSVKMSQGILRKIDYALEFLESRLILINREYTYIAFGGNDVVPKDEEANDLREKRGIK